MLLFLQLLLLVLLGFVLVHWIVLKDSNLNANLVPAPALCASQVRDSESWREVDGARMTSTTPRPTSAESGTSMRSGS